MAATSAAMTIVGRWPRRQVVFIKRRVIVILPDRIVTLPNRDVDLGDMAPGDQIWVGTQETAAGVAWGAFQIPADVPPGRREDGIRRPAGRPIESAACGKTCRISAHAYRVETLRGPAPPGARRP